MNKNRIIGIHGKARAGKDTLAGFLVDRGFYKYSFARPIKDVGDVLFGWDERHREGDLKEVIDSFFGFSPRTFYQLLGTEFGRKMLRDDIWLKLAELQVTQKGRLVIADVRFDNEAEWILSQGGTLVHMIRPAHNVDVGIKGHASENGLHQDLLDRAVKVYNVGSLDALDTYANFLHLNVNAFEVQSQMLAGNV